MANRDQIRVKKESLADDGSVFILLGRPFLFVFTRQIDLKVIIRAVKKALAEIPLIMPLIAMVKELDIFFVSFANESKANRKPDLPKWENCRKDGGRQQKPFLDFEQG